MHLVDKDGRAVNIGDVITDFRGDTDVFRGAERPRHSGSTGRVHTDTGSYYPGVFNLKWSDSNA